MLDFQKLQVYQKARMICKNVLLFFHGGKQIYPRMRGQLSRASLSVMLNIAEGSGRWTSADKKHYYHQSRGSAFESLACLEACYDLGHLSEEKLASFQVEYESISKMLFGMIKTLSG